MVTSTSRRIEVRVENVLEMNSGETRVFGFERAGRREQGFLLRLAEGFVAFCNRCPHWNVDLDLGDERFYDERIAAIVCRNHGAIFEPESGLCTAGPCHGAYLERFEVEVDGTDVRVHVIEYRIIFA